MDDVRQKSLPSQEAVEAAIKAYMENMKNDRDKNFNGLLELEFGSLDLQEPSILLYAHPLPWMANPMGFLHGGITTSYLDFAMGILCHICIRDRIAPTVHMDVDFLRPIPIEDTICIEAKVRKGGRALYFLEGSIWVKDHPEKVLAAGSGSYYAAE